MNYFELFDIPYSFVLDEVVVKNRYDQLVDKYRPEPAGDEARAEPAETISQLEEAYLVFSNPDQTIRYALELKRVIPDEQYEYSEQFLMEVRDINEALMELELDEKQELFMEVEQKLDVLLIKMYDDVEPIIKSYEADTASEETLLQVKDFYYQKKYLQRILDRMNVIRNIASP